MLKKLLETLLQVKWSALASIVVTITIYVLLAHLNSWDSFKDNWIGIVAFLLLVGAVPAVLGLHGRVRFRNREQLGKFHAGVGLATYIVSVSFQLLIVLEMISSIVVTSISEDTRALSLVVAGGAYVMLAIVNGVSELVTSKTEKERDIDSGLNIDSIGQKLESLNKSFAKMQSGIIQDVKQVSSEIAGFRNEYDKKKLELNNLMNKIRSTQSELEQMSHLLSLSENQRNAIVQSLRKRRPQDLVIAFVVGAAASAFVTFMSSSFSSMILQFTK